jgi:glutathione S-transferase
MSEPVLYGAAYSVYVRSARLALAEKGVAYRLQEVDIFAEDGPPPDYLRRQPFGRIPAFEHEGFRLYETGAIIRYIEEAFPSPDLMPADPRARARVNQVLGILDNYAYRTLVWDIFVERVGKPRDGEASDEAKIAQALPLARTCLAALGDIMGDQAYLAGGEQLTLADLHAAPMFAYFVLAPEGQELLAHQRLSPRCWASSS